jgi:hypothetical protein
MTKTLNLCGGERGPHGGECGGLVLGLLQRAQGAAGQWQVHQDGVGLYRATALEQLHGKPRVLAWQQGKPKRGCRGLGLDCQRAKEKDRPFGMARSQLKAADVFRPSGFVEPGQQRTKAVGLQALFEGPEPIGGLLGTDHQKLLGGEAQGSKSRAIGQLRGREQQDLFARMGKATQGRCQEPKLAHTHGAHQEFGEAATGPAPTGELGIEGRVATGYRGLASVCLA